MKTNLSVANPAEVETECLVAVALDRGSKEKPEILIETSDAAIKEAGQEIVGSGEISGKMFETTLVHHPAKLKAKRLLLIGGGKGKNFTAPELRKLAGAAARYLKSRSIRSFAFLAPDGNIKNEDAVSAIVEGAFIGNFDPTPNKSDRKDRKIDSVTVAARGNQAALQRAMDQARVDRRIAEFTRELVNEPGNRMTPTMIAERAQKMAEEVGLNAKCWMAQDSRIQDGRVLGSVAGIG